MPDLNMGCFGSVIMFKAEDAYCAQCPLKANCEVKVKETAELLEEAMGKPIYQSEGKFWGDGLLRARRHAKAAIEQSTPKPIEPAPEPKAAPKAKRAPALKAAPVASAPASKLTPHEASLLPDLRVKVKQLLESWSARGIDPSKVDAGENPFEGRTDATWDYLCVASIIVLGKPTKRELAAEIAARQVVVGKSWSDASINSCINITTGAFLACGYELLKEKS